MDSLFDCSHFDIVTGLGVVGGKKPKETGVLHVLWQLLQQAHCDLPTNVHVMGGMGFNIIFAKT